MAIPHVKKLASVFLLVFTAVFIITSAHAQVEDPPLPDRLNPEQFEPIPYLETETTNEFIFRPDSPDVTTWGKVAFQSYRDGNWEIYTMDDSGYNQQRIASHAKSDIHPRFNRGNTLIAFASNRDGDYEIYVVNADGSGLKQLTFNTTDDANPVWSYDGTKLAFQAYRDGQAEIYTMKSDGTVQTRLTTNSAYEGTPSWSPDGQKIAFVSNRTGGYRIYVMNSQNGSGQTQLTNQPYSFNPTWSPDGKQMAYDADGDGDGWQDLWVMNVDGSNQHVVYNPPGQVDTWARSWFGEYLVAFTEISYILYQGNWYWTQAFASYTRYDSSYPDKFNSSYNTDWNPDWQSSDAIAPISFVSKAPAFLQQDHHDYNEWIAICWHVYDAGGSEGKFTEVQYRYENESWSLYGYNYEVNTICERYYPDTLGDSRFGWFEYRGRTYDHAYNVEPWPAQAEVKLLVYEWRLEATTQDVRGNYLEEIDITAANLLYQTANPELNEQTFYFPEPIQPIAGWESSGFLSLPDTAYTLLNEYRVQTDIYLPAADNIISDWGFESNNLALAWGGSSAAALGVFHSGEVSAPFDATHRSISQTVTIPTNMTNPTLSFTHLSKYSLTQEPLLVTVTEGITQTQFSFITGSHWQQSWIDMSPWLGKTITLTFGNETLDDSFYLDEVTLSSAHPNVWIDLEGDLAALPGETLTYVVRFGNNTNLDAEANTITLTLPSTLNLMSASVPPTVNGNVLTWAVGDLLAESDTESLTVTAAVKSSAPLGTMIQTQVAIDSTTPELVLGDNTDIFSTFVGDLIYLPITTRD